MGFQNSSVQIEQKYLVRVLLCPPAKLPGTEWLLITTDSLESRRPLALEFVIKTGS